MKLPKDKIVISKAQKKDLEKGIRQLGKSLMKKKGKNVI